METAEIYSSGILKRGEEINYCFRAKQVISYTEGIGGVLVFTNQMFRFLKRPSGWKPRGFDSYISRYWVNVLSASTNGLLFKKLNVKLRADETFAIYQFSCDDVENVARKLVACKNNYIEKPPILTSSIDPTKVNIIVEEGPKDSPMKILQKRLARGEISLDEFNKLIQRT